ncbi:alpha/beta hydrolase, partial [Bacillus vallismortis]|nr:alpha/beta hydrolase [Bacillus vallismortis]
MKEKIDRAKGGTQKSYTIHGTEVSKMSSRNHKRTYQIF